MVALVPIAWVDKVTLAGVTYDFVLPSYWYVDPTGSDSNEGSQASPFLTIQHAIDSATTSDTIYVASGTYNESLTVNKSLTLSGANVGLDPNTEARGTEAVIQGLSSISASNVTLNGFTLTNPGQTYAVSISPSASNTTITDDIVEGVGDVALNSAVHAIVFQNGADAVSITHNQFDNIKAGAKSVSAISALDTHQHE